MNLPVVDTVTCPACGGSGQRTLIHHNFQLSGRPSKRRTTQCLACKKTGRVEASRVCPVCANFTDLCTCINGWRNVEPRQMEIEMATDGRIPGVSYDSHNKLYRCEIKRDGEKIYLGSYQDKDLADGIVLEAAKVPVEDIPDLKRQFRELSRQRHGRAEAVVEPSSNGNGHQAVVELRPVATDANTPPGPDLPQLIQLAQDADRRARDLNERAVFAANLAKQAEQDAVQAWNCVADAICELGSQSPSFIQSSFGNLGMVVGHE